ncbi:MAG: efflux RND transporter permease subunit [Deltaproteobacteria bacterium]|nr:efflux RND transporter permease subunit [Deltaproteobacteria bacterium]
MNLAKIAIEKKAVIYFVTILLVAGGIAAFFSLGQLEDPEYSVKTAVILTQYPGASAKEVELEVTDRIEIALQQLKTIDYLKSFSAPGYSQIWVNIKTEYWSDKLPQIWDEMRRKVREVEGSLPPGCSRPVINDDFGDVYGLLLAITGDGFSYSEMEEAAKNLKKELSLVEGVARVELWGVQPKVIYLEASEAQLTQLGISDKSIIATMQRQNMVVDAGSVDVQQKRVRIAPTGEFNTPEDIADLQIHPSLIDSLQSIELGEPLQSSDELIRIRDIGAVERGYAEPPVNIMRLNGQPALTIYLTNVAGANIVDVGRNVDVRMAELEAALPVGMDIHRVHWMSDVVSDSVNGFFINLAQAVIIVLVVLALSMGWRMGSLIGIDLVLTIFGTFIVMAIMGLDLQRMSLGALVIALGMMVDNSIVVAEGFVVRREQGMDKIKAAIESAQSPAMPLLGATVVAVMAFYPIGGSKESTGEYCLSLFTVVGIALMVSWFISMTLTPIKCLDMLPDPKPQEEGHDPYGSKFYKIFHALLEKAIRFRVMFIAGMLGLLLVSFMGFGYVEQLFFPSSSMSKFMIDYYAPQGTRIQTVSADLKLLEEKLLADERVDNVASYIGSGPPRFYLPVEPESVNPAYAQLVVNLHDFREIDGLIKDLAPWVAENYPDAMVPMRKFDVGPGQTWQFQYRISGPAVADIAVLRDLGEQVLDILRDEPLAGAMQIDWRQKVPRMVPVYNQERARFAGVSREDLANATKRAYDGLPIGLYREKDELLPIILRYVEDERASLGSFDVLQVQPGLSTDTLPVAQVTDGFELEWEETRLWRRDRRRTVTIQANTVLGVTLPTLMSKVRAKVEALELPPGYRGEWGGTTEDSEKSQKALAPGLIPTFAVILFILVSLFNSFRSPIVIMLTVPFAMIGITIGLLAFNAPFGFMALLGAMSLMGMMIKNAIVLLDEVNINLANGMGQYDAVVIAALARLRPVVLAAATTVLGVIPLLQDVFWVGMAITIMAGLAFGTVLTMVVVPVLYCIFFKVPSPTSLK